MRRILTAALKITFVYGFWLFKSYCSDFGHETAKNATLRSALLNKNLEIMLFLAFDRNYRTIYWLRNQIRNKTNELHEKVDALLEKSCKINQFEIHSKYAL